MPFKQHVFSKGKLRVGFLKTVVRNTTMYQLGLGRFPYFLSATFGIEVDNHKRGLNLCFSGQKRKAQIPGT